MTLHADLLKQASLLATREPKRPSQASLRRAVSAAYYALFHLLVHDATRLMLRGNARAPIRHTLGRAFRHSTMKTVAQRFATSTPPAKLERALAAQPIQPALARVATTFADLQQARHEADYDLGRRFSRPEVLNLIDSTEEAFDNWESVRGSVQAEAFLTGLRAYNNIQG